MKSYDFDAVVYDGEIYCTACLPQGVSVDSEGVFPVFAGSEWDSYPVCDQCRGVHDYVSLTAHGLQAKADTALAKALSDETELDSEVRLDSALMHGTVKVPVYDDGFGPLWIHRDSMGVSGIVRAQTWEDAYSICEDEFFSTADDAVEEMTRISAVPEGNDRDHEQACWDEAYGFRPNGKGGPTPDKDHGIYAKDMNGDALEPLTKQLCDDLSLVLIVSHE